MSPSRLPIDDVLPQLTASLARQPSVVLRAPTGAGKTTRVPPALWQSGLAGIGQILMLEPRRLAARAAARRMADEHGWQLGGFVGYQVRFERCFKPETRLLVITEGILLGRLHDDPFLETARIVIFDEFHERSLDSDLALGMVRLLQQTVRPDLRIVVMSATLDVDAVAHYLGDCPIVTSSGRLHPVEIVYEPRRAQQPWPAAAAQAVECILPRTPGDVLVFLPGLQEIRQTAHHLAALAEQQKLLVLPLHGDLPAEQQDAALLPQAQRKIVLATNVAETSVTVEGVTGVVDTGLARQKQLDTHLGLDRLQLMPISQASADQRAGRAGRTQPGICIRLWSELAQRARPAHTEPEVRRVDLAGAVLQLLTLGEADLQHFPWYEAPRPEVVAQALQVLTTLGALAEQGVTERGRHLARLPVHPRLGQLLLAGQRLGQPERAALAAALLSERDPFARAEQRLGPRRGVVSDVLERVEALEAFAARGQLVSAAGTLHKAAAHNILQVQRQLLRLLRGAHSKAARSPETSEEALLRALLAAFPDRVAKRRAHDERRGVLVGGRGVRLAPSSGVTEAELFLCIDLDAGDREATVRLASTVQRDWLPAAQVRVRLDLVFDDAQERVVAWRRLCYDDLVLEESAVAPPVGAQAAAVLAEAAGKQLPLVLPAQDSPAGQYLLRLRCLRDWLPELGLPACDEASLREILPGLSQGCRSFAELRQADWLQALQGMLTHNQRQALEREAPERLRVPSGSRLLLQYEEGRPPVLAARIQELFGLAETPRIAAGRVRVLLHLLAPNGRAQQVTDDLASFWGNTYNQVRKDLRARYPKHAWPEDPWTAQPQRKPERR